MKADKTEEDIREAFDSSEFIEKWLEENSLSTDDALCKIDLMDIADSSYKYGAKAQQEKIEDLEKRNDKNKRIALKEIKRRGNVISEFEKELSEKNKQIESKKCCGNCDQEDLQEISNKCEYCIRYEDNGDEGGYYGDNWKPRS